MNQYHVTQTENGWELKKQGATRASKRADTKAELLALTAAFMQNRTATVKIHKMDGTIEEERTYPRSADPRSSKG
jgi:hypothetical protein